MNEVGCPLCEDLSECRVPATRGSLDQLGCATQGCECQIIGFGCRRHPAAGLVPYYCKIHGTLSMYCAVCEGFAATIQVARTLPTEPMRYASASQN